MYYIFAMFIKDSSGILSNTLLQCTAYLSAWPYHHMSLSYTSEQATYNSSESGRKKSYINNLTLENIQSREIRKSIKIKLRCSAQRVKQKI